MITRLGLRITEPMSNAEEISAFGTRRECAEQTSERPKRR
jgi:hypothetical protein